MKEIIGYAAVVLTFVGYLPYVRDTLNGKTRPHVYSWFLWGFITSVAYALQVSVHAGPGSLVTIAAAVVCLIIALLGVKNGRKDITKSDTVFFIVGMAAIGVWLLVKQPVISVVLLSLVDMLAFIPTIRKSWNKPFSETLITYELNTFRFALALFALNNYGIVATLYPATWILANGLFSALLILRRRQLGQYTVQAQLN